MNPCWKSTRSTVNALDYLHEHSWYQRWRNQENIKLGRENSGGLCQDLGTCSTPTNVDVKGTFLLLCFLYTTLYFNYSSITYSLQSRILWHILLKQKLPTQNIFCLKILGRYWRENQWWCAQGVHKVPMPKVPMPKLAMPKVAQGGQGVPKVADHRRQEGKAIMHCRTCINIL